MKVLITGGAGFVGRVLSERLARDGHEVIVLSRSNPAMDSSGATNPRISNLRGNPAERGVWQETLTYQNVIVNLAGASIFSKWSPKQKRKIKESRINTTRNIVEGIPMNPIKPVTLINASAIGYYGFHQDEELDETSSPGEDFLAGVCKEWEAEALKASAKGARVVRARFGIVLGETGGALGLMVRPFKFFIGGPLGSGKQWFSWIHIQDLAEAFVFLISHPVISGAVNLCAPNLVRNKDLARDIGEALHRPSFFRAPALIIRLLLGGFGTVILRGQRVIPRRLLEQGFRFRYPELKAALQNILTHP